MRIMNILEKIFSLKKIGAAPSTEIIAGITTFQRTMSA